jgi:CNT family concentrative nucleoside transporter
MDSVMLINPVPFSPSTGYLLISVSLVENRDELGYSSKSRESSLTITLKRNVYRMYNLVSLCGIFILMLFAWVLSPNRRMINWRVIVWGSVIQLVFAFIIFRVPAGTTVFMVINSALTSLLDVSTQGARFVFGKLAHDTPESLGFIPAFHVFPVIIFFSSLMAILYYLGLMPRLIRVFAKIFTKLMGVSGAEALCTSSNIFVGIESATTVRPYLRKMTRSELCTILTSGMATIASSVLLLYVAILKEHFPTIAGHLVSASILSAPAAIVMSKFLLPEDGRPETLGMDVKPYFEREASLIEAAINGANAGLKLVLGIVAMLIAFLGLMALVDCLFTGVGAKVNDLAGIHIDWSLKGLMGYIFYPFTVVIGVPPSDAYEISKIIGERIIVTEYVSYMDLAGLISSGSLSDPRSAFLATYALCGFAHVASLAIFIGGIAALVPERTPDLSSLGPRALLAATLACLMTAAVAGVFFTGGSLLLGK